MSKTSRRKNKMTRRRPNIYRRPQTDQEGMSKLTAFLMILTFALFLWFFNINEEKNSMSDQIEQMKSEISTKERIITKLQCEMDSLMANNSANETKKEKPEISDRKNRKNTKRDTTSTTETKLIIPEINNEKTEKDTLKQ